MKHSRRRGWPALFAAALVLGPAASAASPPSPLTVYQPPLRSVWEQTMHRWISVPGDVQHFPRGRN